MWRALERHLHGLKLPEDPSQQDHQSKWQEIMLSECSVRACPNPVSVSCGGSICCSFVSLISLFNVMPHLTVTHKSTREKMQQVGLEPQDYPWHTRSQCTTFWAVLGPNNQLLYHRGEQTWPHCHLMRGWKMTGLFLCHCVLQQNKKGILWFMKEPCSAQTKKDDVLLKSINNVFSDCRGGQNIDH